MWMRTLGVVAVIACLSVVAAAGGTVNSKPWYWSPAKVVTRMKASTPIAPIDGGNNAIMKASCIGTSDVSVPGRYSAFRCDVRYGGKYIFRETPLYVRIRPVGSGKLCVVTTMIDGNHYAFTKIGRHGPRIRSVRACG